MVTSIRWRARAVLTVLLVLQLCLVGFSRPREHSRGASRGRVASRGRASSRNSRPSRNSREARYRDSRGSRYSRESRYSARYGRRDVRGRYARADEWRGRGRWSRRPVVASSGSHAAGVHNFLTQSWVDSRNEPASAFPASDAGPTMRADAESSGRFPANGAGVAAGGASPTAPAAIRSMPTAAGSAAGFGAPGAAATVPIVLNPMVSAYAESLSEHGFTASDQGFIVEDMDGRVLAENNADQPFNPASVTKVATSLAAISRLGPDFRFRTNIYTDGSLDPATGILHGSLYLVGAGDPAFVTENALLIADQLNRHGIHIVDGNLVVMGQFYFNFSAGREGAARAFRSALTPDPNTFPQSSAYMRFLSMKAAEAGESGMVFSDSIPVHQATPVSTAPTSPEGDQPNAGQRGAGPNRPHDIADAASQPNRAANISIPTGIPYLKILGETLAQAAVNTANLSLLAVHTSLPLMKVLKGQNDFSNNWMATVIGELVGGPEAVDRFLESTLGLKSEEVRIVTSSGLGSNFVSPRAMAQILRKLTLYLSKQQLGLEQLLPVAGVDHGTLEHRFNDAFRGSIVAKTGTLHSVSALAGIARTKGSGPLIFVIFNHGGSASTFRGIQDETMKKIITLCGGPDPVRYF